MDEGPEWALKGEPEPLEIFGISIWELTSCRSQTGIDNHKPEELGDHLQEPAREQIFQIYEVLKGLNLGPNASCVPSLASHLYENYDWKRDAFPFKLTNDRPLAPNGNTYQY